jgi:hypothetical protein
MGTLLNGSAHDVNAGLYSKTVGVLESRFSAMIGNWQQQRDAWNQFHRTAAGRHVPRRAWMRHGAMLEVISQNRR